MREEGEQVGCRQLEMVEVGAGVASACVVCAESTTMHRSCARTVRGTGPTGETHGSARESERARELASTARFHRQEIERGRGCASERGQRERRRQLSPSCQGEDADARGLAGLH
jgi:hypothetical protein